MKLYLSVILSAMTIVGAVNILVGTAVWYYVIFSVIWCTALQFVLDAIIAFTISKMPCEWFGIDKRIFFVSKKEKALYRFLRVREWKDKVWELGGLGGFSKKKLKEPKSPEYIERFIIECNKGVITHRLSYFIGYLAMLTIFNVCAFTIAFPIATVNLVLNVMPTLILRYNTPRLHAVLTRMQRSAAKANKDQYV